METFNGFNLNGAKTTVKIKIVILNPIKYKCERMQKVVPSRNWQFECVTIQIGNKVFDKAN